MKKRTGKISRKTKETDIEIAFAIDGKGTYDISTTIPFMDHMLALFTKHGLFDLKLKASGDIQVDDHHLVEDLGISAGQALKKSLARKKGLARYGYCQVPMDEALASVAIDISGRPYFIYKVTTRARKIKKFDVQLIEEFLRAFAFSAGINLHVQLHYGRNTHHILEAIFKALGKALDAATQIDPRIKGIPSTKGIL